MLLSRLKAETATYHARIEHDLGLPLDLSSHIKQLEAFYGFLLPFESHLTNHATPDLRRFIATRFKTPLLISDLHFWGYDDSRIHALPQSKMLPPLDTTTQQLGSLYVIEGATLGGQIISRHLERTLGLSGGCGYRYFQGYGQQTGHMWNTFRRFFTEQSCPEEAEVIIESACATFRHLHTWLCREAKA